jgi:hypothetical protein
MCDCFSALLLTVEQFPTYILSEVFGSSSRYALICKLIIILLKDMTCKGYYVLSYVVTKHCYTFMFCYRKFKVLQSADVTGGIGTYKRIDCSVIECKGSEGHWNGGTL